MKTKKIGLLVRFLSTLGILGGFAGTSYYIYIKNNKYNEDLNIKGIWENDTRILLKEFDARKEAGINNENIYVNYYSEKRSLKLNSNSIFQIGNQSETFLAVVLMKLIEETKEETGRNKITLDDKLSKWYDINSNNNKEKAIATILKSKKMKFDQDSDWNYLDDVSIKNLLTHTSGLVDFNNLRIEENDNPANWGKANGEGKWITSLKERENYYKNPITSSTDTMPTSRIKWKLLDFLNLTASKLIDKNTKWKNGKYSDWWFKGGPFPFSNDNKYKNKDYNYSHSNLNYIILANIIEKIKNNGQTFDQIIKEYVLDKLKMKKTFYDFTKITKIKNARKFKDVDISFYNASRGYVSTTSDLLTFFTAIKNKDIKLMSKDSYDEWDKLIESPNIINYDKYNWLGAGGIKKVNQFGESINLDRYFYENFYVSIGNTFDFSTFSFYSKEKNIFLIIASDNPNDSMVKKQKKENNDYVWPLKSNLYRLRNQIINKAELSNELTVKKV